MDKVSKKCQFDGCKMKRMNMFVVCKCEKGFCSQHDMPHTHNCTYDFKENNKKLLAKFNPNISFNKVVPI